MYSCSFLQRRLWENNYCWGWCDRCILSPLLFTIASYWLGDKKKIAKTPTWIRQCQHTKKIWTSQIYFSRRKENYREFDKREKLRLLVGFGVPVDLIESKYTIRAIPWVNNYRKEVDEFCNLGSIVTKEVERILMLQPESKNLITLSGVLTMFVDQHRFVGISKIEVIKKQRLICIAMRQWNLENFL